MSIFLSILSDLTASALRQSDFPSKLVKMKLIILDKNMPALVVDYALVVSHQVKLVLLRVQQFQLRNP